MPDTKISNLTNLATAAVADEVPIVDDSVSETKKITFDNLQLSITKVGTLSAGDVDAAVSAADLTTPGKVELATTAETTTGTDATRAVTPDGLKDGYQGSVNIDTVGTVTTGDVDAVVSAASTTTAGKIEVATTAETDTGTDAARAVSPDALAGSYAGTKSAQFVVFDFTTDVATGNGKFYFDIPSALNEMNLVVAKASVITAGTTGTTDIQIHNLTDIADMLSTVITIDSGETSSSTAATPPVINTTNDDVVTDDIIRVDVDAVSTTAPKGLLVTLEFRLP